jgi:hypothetical protein
MMAGLELMELCTTATLGTPVNLALQLTPESTAAIYPAAAPARRAQPANSLTIEAKLEAAVKAAQRAELAARAPTAKAD